MFQVHFTAEMVGDQDVYVLGREIDSDLEALTSEVKSQAQVLESCLSQLDQYQQVDTRFSYCYLPLFVFVFNL